MSLRDDLTTGCTEELVLALPGVTTREWTALRAAAAVLEEFPEIRYAWRDVLIRDSEANAGGTP